MRPKIPCERCGVMILPSTAERTGGFCMPCKQGNRENIEAAKAFYREQKEYNPFRELWLSLVNRVYRTSEGFEGLNDNEKLYFAVSVLEQEVYNGGLEQFFFNSGNLYSEIVSGLEKLQAKKTLTLLRQATLLLFGEQEPPRDRAKRYETMKKYRTMSTRERRDIELEHIDQQYCQDHDGIDGLLREFAERQGLVTPFKQH